jgi:hypothetical protein
VTPQDFDRIRSHQDEVWAQVSLIMATTAILIALGLVVV